MLEKKDLIKEYEALKKSLIEEVVEEKAKISQMENFRSFDLEKAERYLENVSRREISNMVVRAKGADEDLAITTIERDLSVKAFKLDGGSLSLIHI